MAHPGHSEDAPVVPPSVSLPEITVKGVVLAVALAALLAGANAYLGLFAGMTVSASIPAAVVSMAILRLFRHSNILENNIVQTAASSGEALAAGVIFTIPALLLIDYWSTFHYWHTTAIAAVGGLLGVLFTIPLRRALIINARLRFPEGVATAAVLKVGAAVTSKDQMTGDSSSLEAKLGFRTLLLAACVGCGMKLAESGMRLWGEALEGAAQLDRTVVYLGMNLSPALLAVGFIIGLNTATVVFLGGALGWLILMPVFGVLNGIPDGLSGMAAAKGLWNSHIRYVGIGAMLLGGLWTVTQLRMPVMASLRTLADMYRYQTNHSGPHSVTLRTERDASLPWILGPFVAALVPVALLYRGVVHDGLVATGMTVVMVLVAFVFSAVAAYMAGLVGSSSNPISGVTIATIMLASLLLVLALGRGNPAGPAAALLIGAVVCCAAAMGGDNLQDLKTGHLVGATPWKQQVMQVVGVVTAAVLIVPMLTLLRAKYGIGEATLDHPYPLSAPQATLMANLAQGVFGEGLPWDLVALGALVSGLVIVVDRRLAARGATFRIPVLAVALGIYLPLKLSLAIFAGGIIAEFARRATATAGARPMNRGLLFAAGLVTGEALTGIFLALPIMLSRLWPTLGSDPFRLFEAPPWGAWPGLAALLIVAWLLYRAAVSAPGGKLSTNH
ncbi:MAG: OPT family oligopeptide transporter [Nitrospiraceae bacterium]